MGFALTSASARPFIKHALAHPRSEVAVRSFYFGIDCASSNAPDLLRDGSGIEDAMSPFWYGCHPDYDELCRTFSDVVREAGRNELPMDDETSERATTDGKMARMLLCDQLSRNCFRGTDEAFQYDEVALDLAKGLANEALSDGPTSATIYPMYATTLALPLMHSESIPDHKLCEELMDWGKGKGSNIQFDQKKGFFLQHTEVLE